jgi:hypothetical protein
LDGRYPKELNEFLGEAALNTYASGGGGIDPEMAEKGMKEWNMETKMGSGTIKIVMQGSSNRGEENGLARWKAVLDSDLRRRHGNSHAW